MLRFLSSEYSAFRQMSFGLLALVSVVAGLMLCGQKIENQTVASKNETPVSDAEALKLRRKAQAFYESDQPDSAYAYARASAVQAEKNKDWHTWGEAQTYILAAAYGLQKYMETAAQFPELEQKALAQIPNDSTFWSDYYNTAGAILNEMGNYEAALKYGLKEIAFYEKHGNKSNLALANNNVGVYYLGRGDYDRALEYTRAALQSYISLPDADPADLVWTYEHLSNISYRKKQYDQSISFAEKGLSLLKSKCPDRFDFEALLYSDIASAQTDLGRYESAVQYLSKALEIQKARKLDQNIPYNWAKLGFVYGLMGRLEEAKDFLQRALGALGPGNPVYGKYCRHLGLVLQKQGDLWAALAWQQKALNVLSDTMPANDLFANPGLRGVNAYYDVMNALVEKGRTLELLAQKESKSVLLESSLATLDLATQLLDSMRMVYQEDSKQFWNAEARPILEKAIELALYLRQNTGKEAYLSQAFGYAEKGKAYLLTEALRAAAAKQKAGVPEALLAQEKQISIDIAFYKKQIFQAQQKDSPDTARMLLWQSEILHLHRAYESLLAQLEANYPEYYSVKYKESNISIAQVQEGILENTGLLEYFRGDSATYVFYIDRTHAEAARCGSDAALLSFLEGLRDQDRVREQGRSTAAVQAYSQDAFALYGALISPVLRQIPAQLIVIPDAQLAYLPFELLLTENTGAADAYAGLPYLLRKTTLRYEYSAALALQKPIAHKTEQFFEGYAPLYDQKLFAAVLRGEKGGCSERQVSDFADLTGNREEIAQVAKMTGGKALLGQEATEPYFRAHAAAARILHLAMHGFINDCDPAYSGLVFSATPGAAARDSIVETQDGVLHAYEVYNLHLNAELAVLSACNTGRGKLARGEGVFSLARAFKYAGCSNVLMSLWQADDAATSDIMQRFYGYLQQGYGKAAAIRQAKLDYVDASARNHPFFWSAFVLIGDDLPLQQQSIWPWYLGVFLLSALLVYVFYRYYKRNNRFTAKY